MVKTHLLTLQSEERGAGRLVSKDLYEETPDRGPNPYPFISIFYTSFCLLLYRLYLFDKV